MIINKTQNKIVSEKEIVCKSIFSQGLGLMFHRKHNLIMIFPEERKVSLHNFFVFYPIDVLFLDQHKMIVEIKRKFKPFTFFTPQNKCKYLIELAFPGEYAKGDLLEIKE
jgi:uncharacterized membrane protein (UPF0127 family)